MNEKLAGEATLLATFLGDKEFTKKLKDREFQKYIISQKGILKDILNNGHELMNSNDNTQVEEVVIAETKPTPKIQVVVAQQPSDNSVDGLITEITNMFSGLTGYPVEMLEKDLDLEADLGIDTVKQMEILSMLKEKYGTSGEKIILKDSPTIEAIASSLAS